LFIQLEPSLLCHVTKQFKKKKKNSLKTGNCVQTTIGEEIISALSTTPGRGVYTVVTKSDGLLVINGVMASPFASNHVMANSFYSIHRMLHLFAPLLAKTSFSMSVIESFGDIVVSFLNI
jgi:hypothetical protein